MQIPQPDHAFLCVLKSLHYLDKTIFASQIAVVVAMQIKNQEPAFTDVLIILLQITAHIPVLVSVQLNLSCLLKVVRINAYSIVIKITFYLLTTALALV